LGHERFLLDIRLLIIRKQVECRQRDDMAVFQKELENLSLLSYLKHPNIVQLYCSYIYRQRQNLIFAVADGGSLADFLDEKHGTKRPEDSQLLLALAELADAIDAMHNFTSEALDLSLSGCHHDLAPQNILIHDETFSLADFGLSTFRNTEEDSLTTFKEVRGSYVAPECQTFRGDHVETEKIGRASDIWSFGYILSEVLTHMVLGPNGVAQFCNKKKVQVTPDIEWFRFHRGPGTPSPEVGLWLDSLQANGEPYRVRTVDLIRKMLSMDPNGRPRSVQVLAVLRGISILSITNSVNLGLESACNTHQSIDLMLGKMRFQSSVFAFNRLIDKIDQNELNKLDFDFSKIVQAPKEIHRVLEGGGEGITGATQQQQPLLRYQHARLIEALPLYCRSVSKKHLVKQVLQSDVQQLDGLSTAITEAGEEDIGVLMAVKHLTALANIGCLTEQSNLVLDQCDITLQEEIDIHHRAY
jgi:serine/threonine protein kinase